MAIYRQIHVSYWQDNFILNLTPEEKYFYLYLMTNSKTTQCGIYELPSKIIEFETGYNRETVEKLLQRFIEYGKISYDLENKEIMLLNWIKHNPINNINIKKCVDKELQKVKSEIHLVLFNKISKGLIRGLDTPTKKKEKEEEEEETKTKKEKYKEFVLLHQEEYEKLISEYGQTLTDAYIDKLNNYIGSKGKKYKSHYHTILTWIRKEGNNGASNGQGSKLDKSKFLYKPTGEPTDTDGII